MVISQSDETADSLAALRLAKEKECKALGIVNVIISSIAHEADFEFYILAGFEIAVATTKAYSAQLMVMYCIALQFAKVRGEVEQNEYKHFIEELQSILRYMPLEN